LFKNYRYIKVIILVLGAVLLLHRAAESTPVSANTQEAGASSNSTYLPLLFRSGHPILMGVETHVPYNADVMQKTQDAGTSMVRYFGFNWEKIEPKNVSPQDYSWGSVDESSLIEMTSKGFNVIGTIKFTPLWARAIPNVACGPIASQKFSDFAEFIQALVQRYSKEPYNIKYWEIGNEPDVAYEPVPTYDIYGCWGNKNDPYFGGRHYGEMLKYAYPALKAADSKSQLVIGSLLLDCDPTFDGSCISSKFFDGILVAGGANYFDFVGFHGYPNYGGDMSNDEQHPKWGHRGGVVLGKISYLREVMAKYGVNKPIMHTEGAFLCPYWSGELCAPPGNDFYEAQADYVIWLYIRNWAADIKSTIWYTIEGPGWRYGGMLDDQQNPRPAYLVFKNMVSYLSNTYYTGKVTQYSDPDFRGYAFRENDRVIWVVWSVDENAGTNIILPANVTHVYNKYGNNITPGTNQINVTSPIYIEMQD